jgi:hypothetical protein
MRTTSIKGKKFKNLRQENHATLVYLYYTADVKYWI